MHNPKEKDNREKNSHKKKNENLKPIREKLDNEEQITQKKEKKIYLIRIKEGDIKKHDHDGTITIEKKSTTEKLQPPITTQAQ